MRLSQIFLTGCVLMSLFFLDVLFIFPEGENVQFVILIIGVLLSLYALLRAAYRVVRSWSTTASLSQESDTTEAASLELSRKHHPLSGNVPWRLDDALAVVLVGFFGGQFLGIGGVALWQSMTGDTGFIAALERTETEVSLFFFGYLLAQVITIGVVYLFLRYRRARLADLGFQKASWKKIVGLSTGFLIVYFFVSGVVITVLDLLDTGIDVQAEQDIGFLEAASAPEMIMAFLALVVLAPIVEEVVFRGLLLPAFIKRTGFVLAVIATSVIFGILHPPVNAMIGIGIFAVFLALIYYYTNSLQAAIFLHGLKNLIAFIAIFFFDDLMEAMDQYIMILTTSGLF